MYQSDTLETLKIREPLPIGNFGSVFWSQSYLSGNGGIDVYPDFDAFINQAWVTHYAIPQYGGLKLDIKLTAPLRTGEGFENAAIYIDYLMGTIERSYNRDGNQQATVSDLSIPKALIDCLEKLLRKWRGEQLTVHYSLLPNEGDPLVIWAEFSDCDTLTQDPDWALSYIAKQLSHALAS